MGKFASAVKSGPPRQGHWCDLCAFIEELDEESQAEVKAMIIDRAWSASALATEFAAEGFDGSHETVSLHRKSRAARG